MSPTRAATFGPGISLADMKEIQEKATRNIQDEKKPVPPSDYMDDGYMIFRDRGINDC